MNRLSAVCSLCILMLCSAGLAQDIRMEAKAEKDFGLLNAAVGIYQQSLVVGEPFVLVLRFRFSPEADGLVSVTSRVQLPEGNDIELFITPQGGSEQQVFGALDPAVYSSSTFRMRPGETIAIPMSIIYDKSSPSGFLFEKPGVYFVRANFNFRMTSEHVVSLPSTRIDVKEASGVDAAAYEQLKDPASAKALQMNLVNDEALLKKCQSVGDKYPDSALAQQAMLTVLTSRTFSPTANLQEMIPRLYAYQRKYKDYPGTDQVAYYILAAYNTTGQPDLARAWGYYIRDVYYYTRHFRPTDPLFDFYIEDPVEAIENLPWYLISRPWKVEGATPPPSFQPKPNKD